MNNLRKIDALVAKHVMGWRKGAIGWPDQWRDDLGDAGELRYYSSDIATAWEVVEKLRDNKITVELIGYGRDTWLVKIGDEVRSQPDVDSAPLAICLAALKAKGVEVPE